MKFFVPTEWSEADYDNLLYFVQRLQEMLFHYSIDIYRAPVMNTHQLLYEFDKCYNQKLSGETHSKHTKFVMEELVFSLENDIVLKYFWGHENISRVVSRIRANEEKVHVQHQLIQSLISFLSNGRYYFWCKDYIKVLASQPKEKKKMEQGIRCLLSEMISIGYSPEYIYKCLRRNFYSSDAPPYECINSFFDAFDLQLKEYVVYIGVSKQVTNFQEILENKLDISFDIDNHSKTLKVSDNQVVVRKIVKSLDSNNAAIDFYEQLNLFLKFYRYLGHNSRNMIKKTCLVVESEAENYEYLPCTSMGFISNEVKDNDAVGRTTEALISLLINLDEDTYEVIEKAVELHNSAITSKDIKNGFLNLWSALEVICLPTRYAEGKSSGIKPVISILLPVLQRIYLRRTFADLDTKLRRALSNQDYKGIIDSVSGEDKVSAKIAMFVLLPKYKDLRNQYYEKLANYPVLRSRIAQLDSNGEREPLCNLIERYGERVAWHLRRIYRTRNAISHSGEDPLNLKAIGEHLHLYLDALLSEIIYRLIISKSHGTLSDILIDMEFASDDFFKELNKKTALDEEAIRDLLKIRSIYLVRDSN